jgi:hypothetical protein
MRTRRVETRRVARSLSHFCAVTTRVILRFRGSFTRLHPRLNTRCSSLVLHGLGRTTLRFSSSAAQWWHALRGGHSLSARKRASSTPARRLQPMRRAPAYAARFAGAASASEESVWGLLASNAGRLIVDSCGDAQATPPFAGRERRRSAANRLVIAPSAVRASPMAGARRPSRRELRATRASRHVRRLRSHVALLQASAQRRLYGATNRARHARARRDSAPRRAARHVARARIYSRRERLRGGAVCSDRRSWVLSFPRKRMTCPASTRVRTVVCPPA